MIVKSLKMQMIVKSQQIQMIAGKKENLKTLMEIKKTVIKKMSLNQKIKKMMMKISNQL